MLNLIIFKNKTMKKFTISITLLIITGFHLYSQKTRDVLYLKNGSVINGTLIEITDNQYKIRTSDLSLFVFSASEVDKFVKEAPLFEGRKKEGMGFALEAGFLIGSQNTEYALPFSFNFLANYTANAKDIFGIGSGVEFIGQTFTPLFFEYKHLFLDKSTTPFIFFRAGGLIHLAQDDETTGTSYPQYNYPFDYKGGASLALGCGISWAKEDFEKYLSFAYRYARTSYREENYLHYFATFKNVFNRLEIKFGFRF
ncbi:MAG: hypothetical protein C0408_03605 [Odoribacter sp.]|nr:hypothetical protein [Odoribacter sp.]